MERGAAQPASRATGKLGYDVADRGDLHKLHTKAVGLIGVLFLTVTGAAPISAMLFNVPIAVGYGNGIGAPASFLVATVILLIFSVGYAAMASKVTAVGGFYSFISHGLGRELGMGFGFGSVVAYSVFEASLAGGFAYFANLDIKQWLGIDMPWPILSLIMIVGISILTFFDVKVSTAILGVALIGEVAILTIFAIGVFTSSGAHVDIAAINPINAFRGFDAHEKLAAGAAGIGLFFAFWSWVGFEMAPNYAEESRDPKRIVPLSLYVSVLALGIFYVIVSWAAVSGYAKIDDAIAHGADQLRQLLLRSGDASDRRLGHRADEHSDPDRAPSPAAWPSTTRRPAISILSAASGSCRRLSARPIRCIARRMWLPSPRASSPPSSS